MYQPHFSPSFTSITNLTNISEQLNIAVGSVGVLQGNANSVSQGVPMLFPA